MFFVFCILFLNAVFSTNAVNTDNLIALVQVFRHGERTPIEFYENDPYKNYWGDLGLGQLTNEGHRQLYNLGQFTRSRYSDWIPQKYNRNFFYAQTTDIDRTHMSGQSYLYGLFPATDDQAWFPNLKWQPIPLHPSSPNIVMSAFTECTSYDIFLNEILQTDDYLVKVNEDNEKIYDYISKKAGTNITDIGSAANIFDALKIEHGVGLSLPTWIEKYGIYPDFLRNMSGLNFKTLTYTTQLKRIFTGTLLNEVVEYFENMALNSTLLPKFLVYSAHDSNIAAILNSFGQFEPPYPPEFAATIWMELRSGQNGPYVNIWSKDGDNLTQIIINGCELDCALDEMRTRLSDILVDVETWIKECSFEY